MCEDTPGRPFEASPGERGESALEGVTAAWQQATAALQESERRYRELVEYSLGLICTHDLAGNLLSVNPAAAISLGYRPEEGVGRNLRDFLAPETRHLFDDYLKRIREQGQDSGLMRLVSRNGQARVWAYRNVLTEGREGTKYVLGHAIDVTERVAAEHALRRNEQLLRAQHVELEARVSERTKALEQANERLRREIQEREAAELSRERALIEQRDTLAFLSRFSDRLAPVVTFREVVDIVTRLVVPVLADWTVVHIVNPDATVRCVPGVHANPSHASTLASLRDVASGQLAPDSRVALVMAAGTRVVVTSAGEDLAASLMGRTEAVAAVRRLGAGSAALLPLVVGDRVKAVVSLVAADVERFTPSLTLVVDDVARRVRLALDRIHLYREAQKANRLKDEFLSTLSHELRTPLNAIFGWARILRVREDLDERTAHAVRVIERNAEAQTRLIEEVLDVSRIITGKMTLAMEYADLASILRATIETVRPAIQAKAIRFEEGIAPDLPLVSVDPHRLQQVFWNLLTNAVKFTGTHGLVTVSLQMRDGHIEFEISDTGVGIRRSVLPFVFDRFSQADSSMTRTHGGLGLGLAIVRHIVELHGGTVRAESAGEGHGATFAFDLPIATMPPDVLPDEPRPERVSASTPVLRGRAVLVVEDHDDARELISAVLEAAGARVVQASVAREAVSRAKETKPDLLLADLGLPGEDGFTLLKQVRAIHPHLPAIALTAYARATDRDRALAAGFNEFVVKPIDPQRLVQIVRAAM